MASLSTVVRALRSNGFYYGPQWTSDEAFGVAMRLGPLRWEARDTRITRVISPSDYRYAPSNTLSSRYGLGAFPPHTDTAYWRRTAKYVLLRCIHPGHGGRVTEIFDSRQWKIGTDTRDLICGAVWAAQAQKPFLCTIAETSRGQLAFRYDMNCMVPVTKDGGCSKDVMDDLIASSGRELIRWRQGDLLVLDNHRCIHARGMSSLPDGDRALEKILVGEVL
jgi:L-asparagine oxygenase